MYIYKKKKSQPQVVGFVALFWLEVHKNKVFIPNFLSFSLR
jgi:hypothetical protein